MMDPFTIALLAQGGIAAGQAIAGAVQKSRAQKEREAAREALGETRYADYNQAYYEELQRRAQVGLPEEQRQYMEQQAERAAGVGLAASEDRRAGLMGIGRAQAGLAQSYTKIGLADVAAREQAAQAALGEMTQRGTQTYQEQMQLGQLDLSLAEQARQEGLSQQQAGLQGLMSTAGQAATFYGNQNFLENLYGQGTPQAPVNQGTPNQFSNYTPPQNLSLSQNNSPFASGLNYSPGMSGYGSGLETNYVSGIGSGGFNSGINTAFVPSGI